MRESADGKSVHGVAILVHGALWARILSTFLLRLAPPRADDGRQYLLGLILIFRYTNQYHFLITTFLIPISKSMLFLFFNINI